MASHAAASAHRPRSTCIACGYDLRGAGEAARCPECGFAIADTRRANARAVGRPLWKVRIGLVLTLVSVPPLIVAATRITMWPAFGFPLTLLNLPGPKLWGGPMLHLWRGNDLLAPAFLILNTIGIWLLTASDEATVTRERALSLRRCLRVYAVIAVSSLWVLMSTGRGRLGASELFHPLATILLIELPGTILFYLYLSQLSQRRLRDPSLARRAGRILCAAAALQAFSVIALLRLVPLQGMAGDVLMAVYAIAAIGSGLYALDFVLDLYRALSAPLEVTPSSTER